MGRLSGLEFLTGRGGAVSSTSDRASRDFDSVSCVIEKKKKKREKEKWSQINSMIFYPHSSFFVRVQANHIKAY